MCEWCILNLIKHSVLLILCPKSDQNQFSPNSIDTTSREKVMRVTKQKKSALIFYLILSTKFVGICMANNVENCMWILRLKVFTGHPFLQWVVTWVPVDKIVRNSLSLYQVFRLWGQHKKMWTGKKTVRGFSCMPNSCHFSPSERSQKLSEHLYRAADLLEVTTCHYKGNNLLEI